MVWTFVRIGIGIYVLYGMEVCAYWIGTCGMKVCAYWNRDVWYGSVCVSEWGHLVWKFVCTGMETSGMDVFAHWNRYTVWYGILE